MWLCLYIATFFIKDFMQTTIYNKIIMLNAIQSIAKSYKSEKHYRLTFEEIKQEKTLKQLGYIFGGLIKALNNYQNEIGDTIGDDGKERK